MDTGTLTLTDFLLARFAADEARVLRCDGDGEFRATWLTFRRPDGSMDHTKLASDHSNGIWCAEGTVYFEGGDAQIDEPFFDSRRALAEIEAKRRIVELHRPVENGAYPICGQCTMPRAYPLTPGYPCGTLAALAQPYAGHPDFRPEWRS